MNQRKQEADFLRSKSPRTSPATSRRANNRTASASGQHERIRRTTQRPVSPVPSSGIETCPFTRIVNQELSKKKFQVVNPVEPLAPLTYKTECEIKIRALEEYLGPLGAKLENFVRSPIPRHYRTTTRRRVFMRPGGAVMALGNPSAIDYDVSFSELDLLSHLSLYKDISKKLQTKPYQRFAESLNHVIVRGTTAEQFAIFNVAEASAEIVRKAKLLTDHLLSSETKPKGVFLFVDPSRSEYYMDISVNDNHGMRYRKIKGSEQAKLIVAGRNFTFHPFSFSQVNQPILPNFLAAVESVLTTDPAHSLLDLYCGYGLFSLTIGARYANVTGIDLDPRSVDSARRTSRTELGSDAEKRFRFLDRDITPETLMKVWSSNARYNNVILDPPRNGCSEGVIEFITARKPERVCHVICNVSTMHQQIERWTANGYKVDKLLVVDMFPGTYDVEIVVGLSPA